MWLLCYHLGGSLIGQSVVDYLTFWFLVHYMVLWLMSQVDDCFLIALLGLSFKWMVVLVYGGLVDQLGGWLIFLVVVWLVSLLDGWFMVWLFGWAVKSMSGSIFCCLANPSVD